MEQAQTEGQNEAASAAESSTRSDTMSRSSSSPPLPLSTAQDGANLSDSLSRLNLGAASTTQRPDSPNKDRTNKTEDTLPQTSFESAASPRHPSLRRSASSLSVEQRSTTPTLNKKTSVSSLHGVGGITPPRPASRRSSSNVIPSALAGLPSRVSESVGSEEPPKPSPPTAASLASAQLRKELDLHEQAGPIHSLGKTVVVVHDSCYGHRFSRPRTSKANLATIVERPERMAASVLGVSTAYIRLGGRYAGGTRPLGASNDAKLNASIPFRIHKSRRTVPLSSSIVTNVHGAGWMEELKIMCETAEVKLSSGGKELLRPSTGGEQGDEQAKPSLHEGDLYLCGQSLDALEGSLGAVCDGVDRVFQGAQNADGPRRAFVCIRPPGHHCSSSYPSGFCWLNTVHVGISHASAVHGLTHAAIIDFDLHHGDGSQAITWAQNAKIGRLPKNAPSSKKCPIGYFSVHDINSYPCEWGDEDKIRNASLCMENAHGQTIWNAHLQPWKSEAEFWDLYESRYSVLIEKARNFLRTHSQRLRSSTNSPAPKAAIFVSAGFDASEWEGGGMQRHKVNVPTDFYARISQDIVRLAEEEDLGVNGRVISVLEGGYSDRALSSGVLSHLSGLAGIPHPDNALGTARDGLGYEMGRKNGTVNGDMQHSDLEGLQSTPIDPAWWALTRLEQLEALVYPSSPLPLPKKKRNPTQPTYTTPTQSFVAKIVTSPKPYRSLSGSVQPQSPRSSGDSFRSVTPPPPEVDWATAAHELSKLLIPSDRQTGSCKPEELSAEASRVRRARHSAIGLPAVPEQLDGKRMTLRDRKSRMPNNTVNEGEEGLSQPMSRTDRRKTVAGMDLLAEDVSAHENDEATDSLKHASGRPRRRSSMASSVTSIGGESSSIHGEGHQYVRRTSLGGPRAGSALSSRNTSTAKSTTSTTGPRKARVAQSRVDNPKTRASKSSTPSVQSRPGSDTSKKAPLPLAPNGEMNEVDDLTSSMTRIKLNVPSKEEHDAREKEVGGKKTASATTAIKNTAPAKAGRKPAAPKATRGVRSTIKAPVKAQSTVNQQAPVKEEDAGPTTFKVETPAMDSIPPIPEMQTNVPTDPPRSAMAQDHPPVPTEPLPSNSFEPIGPSQEASEPPASDFIPYIPSSPPAPIPSFAIPPHMHMQQEPLTWLPPNTSTPPRQASMAAPFRPPQAPPQPQPPSQPVSSASTPGKRRGDLPTFTSSSPIPFSKGPGLQPQAQSQRPAAAPAGDAARSGPEEERPHSNMGSGANDAEEAKLEDYPDADADEDPDDIWIIPSTPQARR